MRSFFVIAQLFLCCLVGFGADDQSDLPPELRTPMEEPIESAITSTPLEERIEALEQYARENSAYLRRMNSRVSEVERQLATLKIQMADGRTVEKPVEVSPTATTRFELKPGEIITHIDGVPVNGTGYYSPTVQAPVIRYVAPTTEVRQYTRGGRVFGFLRPRAGTCRIVNGVQVCN